jgi:hypothetical protein
MEAKRPNKRRTFAVQDQLFSKLGAAEYGRLLDAMQAATRRPSRRRRRSRKPVAA